MKTVRALIFDLDGTLVDTLADIGSAVNFALEQHGHPPHSLEAYRGFIGEGVENLVRRSLPAHAQADIASVISAYRVRYLEHMFDQSVPYGGIAEMLASLSALGLPLGVLSNKPDNATRALVEGLFPQKFRETRGERTGVPRKPDPGSALEVARALGVAPHECAFVGDTAIDMKTAANAGMVSVGVRWGFRADELESNGASFVVSHPLEILAVLGLA